MFVTCGAGKELGYIVDDSYDDSGVWCEKKQG